MIRHKLPDSVLAEFFGDMSNMFLTGMGTSQALAALKDVTFDASLIKEIGKIEEEMRQGQTLTQSMSVSGLFPWIVHSTIHAGEESGKLSESTAMLAEYFRQQSDMKKKMAHAFIYPAIVFVLLCSVMLFISLNVVPRLKGLLPAGTFDQGATYWLLALSGFLQRYWPAYLGLTAAIATGLFLFFRQRPEILQQVICRVPVVGMLIKESMLALYFLNLSVLLKSGTALIKAIEDLNAVHSCAVSRRILNCRDYMIGGLPFWESVKTDVFFPSAAVFTLRRGEEMGRLDEYCLQLAQYFDKRVSARMGILAQLVQPTLLMIGGLFLAVIAFAFLMPIYGGLTRIAGG